MWTKELLENIRSDEPFWDELAERVNVVSFIIQQADEGASQVLLNHYRYGRTYVDIGKEVGMSGNRARLLAVTTLEQMRTLTRYTSYYRCETLAEAEALKDKLMRDDGAPVDFFVWTNRTLTALQAMKLQNYGELRRRLEDGSLLEFRSATDRVVAEIRKTVSKVERYRTEEDVKSALSKCWAPLWETIAYKEDKNLGSDRIISFLLSQLSQRDYASVVMRYRDGVDYQLIARYYSRDSSGIVSYWPTCMTKLRKLWVSLRSGLSEIPREWENSNLYTKFVLDDDATCQWLPIPWAFADKLECHGATTVKTAFARIDFLLKDGSIKERQAGPLIALRPLYDEKVLFGPLADVIVEGRHRTGIYLVPLNSHAVKGWPETFLSLESIKAPQGADPGDYLFEKMRTSIYQQDRIALLRHYNGMSSKEIASLSGLSTASISTKIRESARRVRNGYLEIEPSSSEILKDDYAALLDDDASINKLSLGVTITNNCYRSNIITVGQLLEYYPYLKNRRGFGEVAWLQIEYTVNKIKEARKEAGVPIPEAVKID